MLKLARRQLADYDARLPGSIFSQRSWALDETDAYRIQMAVAKLRCDRGERVAGYKIGCVSEAVRRQLGVEHAVFGHIYASEIRRSPSDLWMNEFCHLGVEGEFAVTLSDSIDDPSRFLEDPERFVRSIQVVIELHNYVFRGPKPVAGELIANNALHAGIVVPATEARSCPRGPLTIHVAVGDRVNDSVRAHPLGALNKLVARLAAAGIKPRSEDILLTGSPLPLYLVEPGESVKVSCDGLAEVSACIQSGSLPEHSTASVGLIA